MSSFVRRLLYYGIGFLIGCVFVFIFFQNRGCSWLPDNRIKNAILERVIVINESVQQELNQNSIDNNTIIELLNTGKVNYGKSQKDGESKVYLIENEKIQLYYTLPYESFISEVHITDKSADQIKNSTKGMGKMIHFPNDKGLIYVDTVERLTCESLTLGFTDAKKLLNVYKNSGEIDFSKSNLKTSKTTPKATQYIVYTDSKGQKIGAKAIWYKNKININYFDIPFKTNCF